MHFRPSRPRFAAFTLVEVLAVIIILAILAAVLFPSLKSGVDKAKSVKCISNLRQFGMGIQAYSADHGGVIYPPCPNGTWYWCGQNKTLGISWGDGSSFAPYVGDANGMYMIGGIFSCPMINADFPGFNTNPPGQPFGAVGYTMNTALYSGNARLVNFGDHLSEVIVMMDGYAYALDSYLSLNPLKTVGRHHGAYNALFMDGHVGALQPSEVQNTQAGRQPLAGRLKGR